MTHLCAVQTELASLYTCCVGVLENRIRCEAFDRVPREVVRLDLSKLGVDEWLIRTVITLYTEAFYVGSNIMK